MAGDVTAGGGAAAQVQRRLAIVHGRDGQRGRGGRAAGQPLLLLVGNVTLGREIDREGGRMLLLLVQQLTVAGATAG